MLNIEAQHRGAATAARAEAAAQPAKSPNLSDVIPNEQDQYMAQFQGILV